MKRIERVRLYPTNRQRERLAFMLDVTRQLYNALLEERRDAYRRYKIRITAKQQYAEITSLRTPIKRRLPRLWRRAQCRTPTGLERDNRRLPSCATCCGSRSTFLASDVTRLYIGLGRRDAIRPADIVGAFANEGGISARDIGAIEIADRFSLIEVPTSQVERLVKSLRHTEVRGKKLGVRRDRK